MVLLLLIVKLVVIASNLLVHVAVTDVDDGVGIVLEVSCLSGNAGGCRFWYRRFGNLGAFIGSRIGLIAALFFFICLFFFFKSASILRGRASGVRSTSACSWAGGRAVHVSSSVSVIRKSLQICYNLSELLIRPIDIWWNCNLRWLQLQQCLPAVYLASLCGYLLLTGVEIYYGLEIRINNLYISTPWFSADSLPIDIRLKVDQPALLQQSNSNWSCWSLVGFTVRCVGKLAGNVQWIFIPLVVKINFKQK